MEERIIDDPRKIKVTKNSVGGIADATDALAEGGEAPVEEELTVELPEEYDEDLVGLKPSELEKRLKEREKAVEDARIECGKYVADGEAALKKNGWIAAENFFAQALVYDPDCARAKEGLWIARTKNFKDLEPFYALGNAKDVADSDDKTRAFIRKNAGERLAADRAELEAEEKPLAERVLEGQETRRVRFGENRKYYIVRSAVFIGILAMFLIAAGVSAYFIFRTQSQAPVYLSIGFGALAAVSLVVAAVYITKLAQAQLLCMKNERLSSTEDGKRLKYLRERLLCLQLILDN